MLRRISGGAAVVVGPGCLMYALVLSLRPAAAIAEYRPGPRPNAGHDRRRAAASARSTAFRRKRRAPPKGGSEPGGLSQGPFRLKPVLRAPEIARRGTCDLAIGDKKVSGNSVRCRRDYLLYHGTLLYDFPLQQIGRLLAIPPRQPDYRQARATRCVRDEPAARRRTRSALRCAPRGEPTMVVRNGPKPRPRGWLRKSTRAASGTNSCKSGRDVIKWKARALSDER